MAGDDVPPRDDESDVLRDMAARLRAGERPNLHEVERRLEAGFGALIGLEAELARVQRASAREEAAARAAAGADLMHRIGELREALSDLRTLTVPPGESRVGYGFVLPRHEQRLHAHPN